MMIIQGLFTRLALSQVIKLRDIPITMELFKPCVLKNNHVGYAHMTLKQIDLKTMTVSIKIGISCNQDELTATSTFSILNTNNYETEVLYNGEPFDEDKMKCNPDLLEKLANTLRLILEDD